MPKTKKTIQPKNLAKYDVFIEDTSPNSTYFQVTNLPSFFTGGRNSFLVAGSPFLKRGSAIQIEILDSNGNTIYQNPVQKYVEGNSRLISIEINDTTAVGFATIILMGQAAVKSDGSQIPPDWQSTYNVRWVTRILVEPNLRNVSQLILENQPVIITEEQRLYSVSTASFVSESTKFTASLTPTLYSSMQIGYLIQAVAPTSFSADYLGGYITGSMLIDGAATNLYIPITDILDETTAFSTGQLIRTVDNRIVDKLYLYSGSYTTPLFGTQSSIVTSAEIVNSKLTTQNLNVPVSYGKLRVVNMNTVSGEIYKVKVYSKVTTNISDYKVIADVPVTTSELLTTSSLRGEFPIGNFNITKLSSSNWYSDQLETSSNAIYPISGSPAYYNSATTSTPITLVSTNKVLMSSIYANVSTYNNQQYLGYLSASGYFIGTKRPVTLFPTSEYTLELDAVYKKVSGSVNLIGVTPVVDIYIVGVDGTSVIDNNPLGQKIGTLSVVEGSESQRYQKQQFNFTPAISTSGTVGVRLAISNGFWHFSNISLKPASDRLFAPDEAQFLVPNTEYYNEYLQYKVEFFDINNNSTDISIISVPTFFSGSNIDLGVLP